MGIRDRAKVRVGVWVGVAVGVSGVGVHGAVGLGVGVGLGLGFEVLRDMHRAKLRRESHCEHHACVGLVSIKVLV